MKTRQRFKHLKSVKIEDSKNGWVNEYDQYDRNTYHKSPSGYWVLSFYDEPQKGERVNHQPYQVIHKYWEYYNN